MHERHIAALGEREDVDRLRPRPWEVLVLQVVREVSDLDYLPCLVLLVELLVEENAAATDDGADEIFAVAAPPVVTERERTLLPGQVLQNAAITGGLPIRPSRRCGTVSSFSAFFVVSGPSAGCQRSPPS